MLKIPCPPLCLVDFVFMLLQCQCATTKLKAQELVPNNISRESADSLPPSSRMAKTKLRSDAQLLCRHVMGPSFYRVSTSDHSSQPPIVWGLRTLLPSKRQGHGDGLLATLELNTCLLVQPMIYRTLPDLVHAG